MMAAILSGCLTAIAFPTVFGSLEFPRLAPLAWFSLVPFYLSIRGESPKTVCLRTGVFGFAFYTISYYWVFTAMHVYGAVPVWGSVIGLLAQVAIFSVILSGAMGLAAACRKAPGGFGPVFVLAWVAQDFFRSYFPFGGFPWSSLGYVQASFNPLIQIVDITGIYGLTFLTVLGNVVVAEFFLGLRRQRPAPVRMGVVFLITVAGVLLYGTVRIGQVSSSFASRPTKTIAIIQANIPQDEKWLTEMSEEILARHLALTAQGESKRGAGAVDLTIWPEASFPETVPPGILTIDPLKGLKSPLLMGAITYEGMIPEVWPPVPGHPGFSLFNSALVIEPGGWVTGEYRKNHLVPLGEYVPLGRFLFFLQKIVPAISSFTEGRSLNLLTVSGIRVGVTICFEDLFPEISRSFVRQGADLFVNLTNDAWFGRSSALFQHFDFSNIRAVENRRAVVRATNTGISGVIDATGKVLAVAPLFSEAVLTVNVPVGGPVGFYARVGDLFAWCCVFSFILIGVLSCVKSRKV